MNFIFRFLNFMCANIIPLGDNNREEMYKITAHTDLSYYHLSGW